MPRRGATFRQLDHFILSAIHCLCRVSGITSNGSELREVSIGCPGGCSPQGSERSASSRFASSFLPLTPSAPPHSSNSHLDQPPPDPAPDHPTPIPSRVLTPAESWNTPPRRRSLIFIVDPDAGSSGAPENRRAHRRARASERTGSARVSRRRRSASPTGVLPRPRSLS